MTEQEIRSDFEKALGSVEEGSELSSTLGWGFYDKDIVKLAKLHKEKSELRDKIEDLLTDCNFHSECKDFCNENYDKYLKKGE